MDSGMALWVAWKQTWLGCAALPVVAYPSMLVSLGGGCHKQLRSGTV
jgi:hypothetical protein